MSWPKVQICSRFTPRRLALECELAQVSSGWLCSIFVRSSKNGDDSAGPTLAHIVYSPSRVEPFNVPSGQNPIR